MYQEKQDYRTSSSSAKLPLFLRYLKLTLLIPPLYVFYYMTLYTKYAPDTYVFVQYAVKDNLFRTIDQNSLLNNNVIFDLLTILGDLLQISTPIDWLNFITIISMFVFAVKYIFLLEKMNIFPVIIIYFSSFFVDLNQLRFNISSILLYYIISNNGSKAKILGTIVGFSSHIMPFILYFITYARRNISKSLVGILPIFMIVIGTGFFNYLMSSRIFSYFTLSIGAYPKVLLLFFPLLLFFIQKSNGHKMRDEIVHYAMTSFIVGLALFLFNYELTARFFEIAFVAVCVANGFSDRKPPIDFILLITALTIFGSRLMSGISTQTDFAEQYMQSW